MRREDRSEVRVAQVLKKAGVNSDDDIGRRGSVGGPTRLRQFAASATVPVSASSIDSSTLVSS